MARSKGEALFALHCRAEKLGPIREYRFAPPRRWRFDFCWPDKLLAVEIEGGVWLGKSGGHTSGTGMIQNMEKYNAAVMMGYRVLRFTPQMVQSGEAIGMLLEYLSHSRIESPQAGTRFAGAEMAPRDS